MTIICYKDGILAVDSMVAGGGVLHGTGRKTRVLKDGRVAAHGGMFCEAIPVFGWLDAGAPSSAKPKVTPDHCEVMVVSPDGTVLHYDCGLEPYIYEAPGGAYALGSGEAFALGAMAAGATAEEACRIACEYDSKCGLPVVVHKIGDKAVIDMTPHMLHRSAQEAG